MNSPVVTINHQAAVELALCQRDYDLLGEHYPDILKVVEVAVDDRITPETIRRWAVRTVQEPQLVQRVFNAARWYGKSKGE